MSQETRIPNAEPLAEAGGTVVFHGRMAMHTYLITIDETVTGELVVEAESLEAARDEGLNRYRSGILTCPGICLPRRRAEISASEVHDGRPTRTPLSRTVI